MVRTTRSLWYKSARSEVKIMCLTYRSDAKSTKCKKQMSEPFSFTDQGSEIVSLKTCDEPENICGLLYCKERKVCVKNLFEICTCVCVCVGGMLSNSGVFFSLNHSPLLCLFFPHSAVCHYLNETIIHSFSDWINLVI